MKSFKRVKNRLFGVSEMNKTPTQDRKFKTLRQLYYMRKKVEGVPSTAVQEKTKYDL